MSKHFFILPSYLNCLKTYSLSIAFPKLSAANFLSGIFFRLLNHTFPGALVCCNFWLIVSLSGLKYIWTGDSLVTDLRYSLPSFSCLAHKCHEVNILHLSALVSLAPFTWGHAKFSLEYWLKSFKVFSNRFAHLICNWSLQDFISWDFANSDSSNCI